MGEGKGERAEPTHPGPPVFVLVMHRRRHLSAAPLVAAAAAVVVTPPPRLGRVPDQPPPEAREDTSPRRTNAPVVVLVVVVMMALALALPTPPARTLAALVVEPAVPIAAGLRLCLRLQLLRDHRRRGDEPRSRWTCYQASSPGWIADHAARPVPPPAAVAAGVGDVVCAVVAGGGGVRRVCVRVRGVVTAVSAAAAWMKD